MPSCTRAAKWVWLVALGVALGACSSQKEPARVRIGEIEATLSAAAAEAQTYVPERLRTVQDELAALQKYYDTRDYAAVVSGSPAVLHDAESLRAAASAAKIALIKVLNEQWTRLAASVPDELNAVQNRIDVLAKKSNKRLAAGSDLTAAAAGLADAASLWSKAQAAFAGGNLREAVSTANTVQTKLVSLAATL